MKRIVKILFSISLIVIMTISGIFLYKNFKEDKKQEEIFEEIQEIVNVEIENVEAEESNSSKGINISRLYEMNKDFIGWLKIENTNINYPVMQTKDNPNYYLRRNFYKQYSYYGTPYLAENCKFNESDNLVIYGHHIANKKMFGELENYREKSYWNNHKEIDFYTLDTTNKYEIVYAFQTTAYTGFEYYKYINFDDENEFETFNNKCKELAFYDTESNIEYNDKLITLSTCDYTSENSRLVIIAKQI